MYYGKKYSYVSDFIIFLRPASGHGVRISDEFPVSGQNPSPEWTPSIWSDHILAHHRHPLCTSLRPMKRLCSLLIAGLLFPLFAHANCEQILSEVVPNLGFYKRIDTVLVEYFNEK